ncbi:MAG: helix-turn-helix domain-containing protein [Micromonosporaceae bacterium]
MSPNPDVHPIAFGQRMQILRERRGISRPVLAGLLARSPSWVKQVENGKIGTPGLPMMLRIAEVLRIRSLSDLTGDQSMAVEMFIGPGHKLLPAVRDAVNTLSISTDQEAPSPAHLRARLARAWAARHSAPNHREVVGALLPSLIDDAERAVRQADRISQRRSAQAALSEVYGLSQFFLAYQPDSSLLWRVAERAMVAAQDSGDAHTIGVAAWLLTQAHRDAGGFDAADAVTNETLRFLESAMPDSTSDVRAIVGALTFEAGHTAARRGDAGAAWRYWDGARAIAQSLPADYYHPITSFSRAIMRPHGVTVAVELHAGGESVRQAVAADTAAIPSRPRLARHRIEAARGYHLDGQPEAALATLGQAFEAAPETIRYNGYARRIMLEETEAKSPARRRRASELAVKVGLLAA